MVSAMGQVSVAVFEMPARESTIRDLIIESSKRNTTEEASSCKIWTVGSESRVREGKGLIVWFLA